MKKVGLLLILTLAAFAPSAAGQGATWTRYTYPGDEFSVELPAMPWVFHTFRGGKGLRPAGLKVRVFGLYSDGIVYMVAANDEPQKSESLDTFAGGLHGWWTLKPKGEATQGGMNGGAYEVEGRTVRSHTQELYGEARAFRTKRHAYVVVALSTADGRPEVARFLDSLTIDENPAGESVKEDAPVPRFVPPEAAGSTQAADEEMLKLVRREGGGALPADGPFTMRDVERKALIVYKPEPPYTEEARQNRVSGALRLRAVLSPDGRVTDVSAVSWLPHGLTDSAMRVARHMLFFPAEKGGRPVPQYVLLEYNFSIY
ncbi:MAG TPA: energy transducer TonB [Pyrinomonadaceae bacterium]|nr:energy transducer TonB [Pyrinomonadaceae bacterium]